MGLEFADPGGAEYTLPDIPQIPPASKIRNRKNEVKDTALPAGVAGGSPKLSAIGGVHLPFKGKAGRGGATESAAAVQRESPRAIGKSEQDELRENLSEMLQTVSEWMDSAREAYLNNHPIADEHPLFALEKDENKELTGWLLRRGEKSPRMAQRIRVTTDLYDSFAIPAVIILPRLKTFLSEVRKNGVNIRGR